MSKKSIRQHRVEDLLQQEIAMIIRQHLTPSEMGVVGITGVDVSPDLRNAKVFVSSLDESSIEGIVLNLNEVQRQIHGELFSRLHMKRVPKLEFVYDNTLHQAAKISSLLKDQD